MGEYADMAIDAMLSQDEYYFASDGLDDFGEPVYSPFRYNRRDKRRAKRAMRECQFCQKFPLFFHEERPNKWILAEWNDENRPIRHVCKLKRRLNAIRRP